MSLCTPFFDVSCKRPSNFSKLKGQLHLLVCPYLCLAVPEPALRDVNRSIVCSVFASVQHAGHIVTSKSALLRSTEKVSSDGRMVFNTISIGAAVTPTVIETYFSHVRARLPTYVKNLAPENATVPQSQTPAPEAHSTHFVP